MSLKKWERRGKRGLTRMAGRVLRARGDAPAIPDLADLSSILLIRQQNQLGDMLLGSPVLRAIRCRAPEARIDLISGPPNHDAVRGNRNLDEVLLYDKATFLRRPHEAKRFADRLRDGGYEIAIVLSTVSFSVTSAWLAALSRARWRAGRPGPGGRGAQIADDLYHWVLPAPVEGRHQTGVNLDGISPFGAVSDDWTPEIHLDAAEQEQGAGHLGAAIGPADRGRGLRIVVHPGAGKLPNRWPAERFGEVAAALEAAGHRVAVAAGPGEEGLPARVDAGAGRPLARLPGSGVRVLAGAIRAADLLLANDTGILHLGASVGVPVLALFGPTDPAIWCPSAPRVRWMRPASGALVDLPTASVRAAAVAWADHLAGAGAAPVGLEPAPAWSP